ncbi:MULTISPECIES: sulfite exporter TauE/SafE family protein [Dietzia]|uniref:Probable membrane transporter protein n=1 Tax=Dietzia maris TaxID=37915 RepID=A0ABT8H1W7_9ACTN|nr:MULTISPECIES: sulfite exporter TauE/SafE family protein [Dietzia]MCZ4539438.1 sulfite exporter TauE/SafE family protein [Dietzia maris]MCZ4656097.1 sulfite exporter TauE/SafE family protein [Dietzia kunjamensis]MDJ0422658.1 sulfite exporter TauE/SafE family protein [Dietzia kunjamensis]MDN4506456.1 sulfite exporter TauE/SafE family protein [Dietzia maris]MDV3354588.1 sulfite exporter TauE/SafE family protein [Dietzia sp. IN118]
MKTLIVLGVVGAIAQLIDGSLGMAYGVTSTTLLVAAGIAPAAASASVHFAEIGTTLASGVSHHRLGNVDWRIVRILAVPGAIGAFAGATLLSSLPADVAKPVVGAILLSLGLYVLYRFLALGGRRPEFRGRVRTGFLVPLGLVGGTLDSLGGGGWGPVGTTSLLSSGRVEPRKVVGSIDTSEFVVAVGGSLGFLVGLGAAGINWGYALALLVGGVLVAPLAAWLVKHLPARVLGTAAGGLIVVTNSRTLLVWAEVPSSATTPILLSLVTVWIGLVTWAVLAKRRASGDDDDEAGIDPAAAAESAPAQR